MPKADRRRHQGRHPGGDGARDHGLAILVEGGEVEVALGVDERRRRPGRLTMPGRAPTMRA